jgi:hypothetical protein
MPVPPGPDTPVAACRVPVSEEQLVLDNGRRLLGELVLFKRGLAVEGSLIGERVLLVE